MLTLLIIDDDPDIAELITISVRRRWPNARVVAAPTGKQGLAAVRAECPSAVVLDYGLPDINGVSVCEGIREFSSVPVVVLSGQLGRVEREMAFAAGANEVLDKPVVLTNLLNRLDNLLSS